MDFLRQIPQQWRCRNHPTPPDGHEDSPRQDKIISFLMQNTAQDLNSRPITSWNAQPSQQGVLKMGMVSSEDSFAQELLYSPNVCQNSRGSDQDFDGICSDIYCIYSWTREQQQQHLSI
ncbi:hypothetical protein TNCV_111351 [Trichonephila clavipes]|nr:hypothetical protein TNCV_111351 [Trichonephila clavipes]